MYCSNLKDIEYLLKILIFNQLILIDCTGDDDKNLITICKTCEYGRICVHCDTFTTERKINKLYFEHNVCRSRTITDRSL